VILSGIELIRCRKCGNVDPVIPSLNELYRALALALVSQPFRLQGEDVRYLRKYLGMTQDTFAELLHIHKSNLSKWENNEDNIGQQSERLIRTVVLTLGAGLQKNAADVVRAFPAIRETTRKRLEVNALKDYAAKVA
jgi:DNA-binding transcriptional regulator YiaG